MDALFCSAACYNARYAQTHRPERIRAHRDSIEYGLAAGDRERLLAQQDNRCAICRTDTPRGYWVVDHCHKTGIVRGILCQVCNSGIGYLQDDPELLRRALVYIEAASV